MLRKYERWPGYRKQPCRTNTVILYWKSQFHIRKKYCQSKDWKMMGYSSHGMCSVLDRFVSVDEIYWQLLWWFHWQEFGAVLHYETNSGTPKSIIRDKFWTDMMYGGHWYCGLYTLSRCPKQFSDKLGLPTMCMENVNQFTLILTLKSILYGNAFLSCVDYCQVKHIYTVFSEYKI